MSSITPLYSANFPFCEYFSLPTILACTYMATRRYPSSQGCRVPPRQATTGSVSSLAETDFSTGIIRLLIDRFSSSVVSSTLNIENTFLQEQNRRIGSTVRPLVCAECTPSVMEIYPNAALPQPYALLAVKPSVCPVLPTSYTFGALGTGSPVGYRNLRTYLITLHNMAVTSENRLSHRISLPLPQTVVSPDAPSTV